MTTQELFETPLMYIRTPAGAFILAKFAVDAADLSIAEYSQEEFDAIFEGQDTSMRFTDFLNAAGLKYIRLVNPICVGMSMTAQGPTINFGPYILGLDPKADAIVTLNISSIESIVSATVVPNLVEAYTQLRTPIDLSHANVSLFRQ